MNSSGKYDFRQFQEELAALERQQSERTPAARPGRRKAADPLAEAKQAFEALRERYGLTVADVVAWFPEEEGIAYLQSLLAQPVKTRGRKPKS